MITVKDARIILNKKAGGLSDAQIDAILLTLRTLSDRMIDKVIDENQQKNDI